MCLQPSKKDPELGKQYTNLGYEEADRDKI